MPSHTNLDDVTSSLFKDLREINALDFGVLKCPICPEQLEALELHVYPENGQIFQRIWWTCKGIKKQTCHFPLWVPHNVFWTKRTEEQMRNGFIPLPNIHLLPENLRYLYPKIFATSSDNDTVETLAIVDDASHDQMEKSFPTEKVASSLRTASLRTMVARDLLEDEKSSEGLQENSQGDEISYDKAVQDLISDSILTTSLEQTKASTEISSGWETEKTEQKVLPVVFNLADEVDRKNKNDQDATRRKKDVNEIVNNLCNRVSNAPRQTVNVSSVTATMETLRDYKQSLAKSCDEMTLREYIESVKRTRKRATKNSWMTDKSRKSRAFKSYNKLGNTKKEKVNKETEVWDDNIRYEHSDLEPDDHEIIKHALRQSAICNKSAKVVSRPKIPILKGKPSEFRSEMIPEDIFNALNQRRPVHFGGRTNVDAFVTVYNLRYNRSEYLEAMGSELFKRKVMNFVPSIPVKQQRFVRRMKALKERKSEDIDLEKIKKSVDPSTLRLQIAHRLGIKNAEKSVSQIKVIQQRQEKKLQGLMMRHIASAPLQSLDQAPQSNPEDNPLATEVNDVVYEQQSQLISNAGTNPGKNSGNYINGFEDPEMNALVHRKLKSYANDRTCTNRMIVIDDNLEGAFEEYNEEQQSNANEYYYLPAHNHYHSAV